MNEKKWVGLFPGQGSQSVGMGKELYDEFTVFRQTVEEASDTLREDLKGLLFEGNNDELTLTHNAQPALLTVSTGVYRVLEQEVGVPSHIHLGHSLGEYSALVASEAFSFATAVTWVRERGLAMQTAVPVGLGSMSAVMGMSDIDLTEWCKIASQHEDGHTVEIANRNAPGQIVVSGGISALERLENGINEKKIRGVLVKRLNVSAPFHSRYMKPARTRMEKLFQEGQDAKEFSEQLTAPYIPNRTARISTDTKNIPALLADQIDGSVLWQDSCETLMEHGYARAIEFGPGKVLQGLMKRISKGVDKNFEVYPVYDLETLKTLIGVYSK